LPEVTTIQVPSDLGAYPDVIERLKDLFPADASAGDGSVKTAQYRARRQALDAKHNATDQATYLASLGLVVDLRRNDRASVARIAELTQKSNQFNLATRRHTPAQIDALMASGDHDVYSVHVSDRFGDAGLTGVVITSLAESGGISIDDFLMSCRILGRDVELSIWEPLIGQFRADGRDHLLGTFSPTAKNAQVETFWDQLGLELVGQDRDGRRRYRSSLDAIDLAPAPLHIKVNHVF
jgi:FkbH-like protein